MKNSLHLSIARPCSEKWENFTPTTTGGFCSTCSKNVIDFTSMSQDEIAGYFKNNSSDTCGRFLSSQLKSYVFSNTLSIQPGLKLLRAGFVAMLLAAANEVAMAQDNQITPIESVQHAIPRSIKGIVRSAEDGSPLQGVNVMLKGSGSGTATDPEGKFEFPVKLKRGDVLQFSFLGLATRDVIINDNTNLVDINLEMSWELTGKVAVDGIYSSESGTRKLWTKIKGIF